MLTFVSNILCKQAFRAGAVDLTSDQLAVSVNQITIPNAQTDINVMLPEAGLENWDAELLRRSTRTPSKAPRASSRASSGTPGDGRSHLARQSDITLPQAQYDAVGFGDDSGSMDLLSSGMGIAPGEFDPDGGLDLGLDLFGEDSAAAAAAAPSRQRGTQRRRDTEGRLVDENGDVIRDDDLSSIGVGRDAAGEERQPSLGSLFGADAQDISMDFGADAGADFGPPAIDDFDMTDVRRPEVGPEASSSQLLLEDMTPRTKKQVQEATERRAAEAATKSAKERKQLIDRVTELDEGARGGGASALGKRNVDDIITVEQYLPRSSAYAGVLDIYNDPLSRSGNFAPLDLGLAPELNDMFAVNMEAYRIAKRARVARTQQQQRRDSEEMPSMEIGRRAPTAEADEGRFDFGGDDTFDMGAGASFGDMPPMDEDAALQGLDVTGNESGLRRSERQKALDTVVSPSRRSAAPESILGNLPPLSRLGTPEVAAEEVDSFSPSSSKLLAAFEARPAVSVASGALEDDAAAVAAAAEDASTTRAATQQGFSKNTVRAQRLLRSQLSSRTEGEGEEPRRSRRAGRVETEESVAPEVSFDKLGENASRRAAASFFFELLVLGTKDQIELNQEEAYGDVTIKAKESLWV